MSKQNKIQKIRIFFRFIFELYKILTSTLVIFFVPQKCDNGERICSFTENFNNIDPYNIFVLYFNITTSFVFMIYYFIEIYRERIFIMLLDINNNIKDKNHYKNEIKKYPKIKQKINDINYIFYHFNLLLILIFIINILVSLGIVVKHYLNDLTIFITLTNTIIILDKLLRSYFIAKKSYYQKRAYSMYTIIDVMYNTIDKDIKKKRKKKLKNKENVEIKVQKD